MPKVNNEKKIIITLLLSILIISCSDSINESQDGIIQLSDTTQIYFKQTLYNFKESLSIQFDNLVSDSRCPIDAICVWEGDAEVRFKFKIELQTQSISITAVLLETKWLIATLINKVKTALSWRLPIRKRYVLGLLGLFLLIAMGTKLGEPPSQTSQTDRKSVV